MSRVDAARRLMSVPGRGAEATGRLFVAKRFHEAAKANKLNDESIDGVLDDLSDGARPFGQDEMARIRRHLQAAK